MRTVAIVGRPNVGKSTLFNRLVGRRLAIVDPTPGVTRDRREGTGRLGPLEFRVIDTAGYEEAAPETLSGRMRRQTEVAVADADVALFVIDALAGVTPTDEGFAAALRKQGTPVVLVANKCEGRSAESGLLESFALGLGDPVAISAEHGEGLAGLYEAIVAHIGEGDDETADAVEEGADTDELRLAIVGRPNVGKSTLVNRLLGEERLLTGPEAGITRDAIAVSWHYGKRPVKLVDTAGIRRRARVDNRIEKLAVADTERSIDLAQVVVLLIDATQPLEKQDLTIARQVTDEGRALLIAANKWDLIDDPQRVLLDLRDRIDRSLAQVRGVPVVTLSALAGTGVSKLMPAVDKLFRVWNRRVPTRALNEWLAEATAAHPPPLVKGRRIRLRYITQAKIRPPTFVIFSSQPAGLPESYLRYLGGELRRVFQFDGVPLRLLLRKGANPYAPD